MMTDGCRAEKLWLMTVEGRRSGRWWQGRKRNQDLRHASVRGFVLNLNQGEVGVDEVILGDKQWGMIERDKRGATITQELQG